MDVVYLLVSVVCVEVAVISAGLFWYLPRVIARSFVDAEVMIQRIRQETFEQAQEFIEGMLCAENIERLAAIAGPVLGNQMKKAAGGMISGQIRRRGGDMIGSIVEGALGAMMGGNASPAYGVPLGAPAAPGYPPHNDYIEALPIPMHRNGH